MPGEKGSLVEYMVTTHKISQRQACKAIRLPQSSSRYKHKPKKDDALISELQLLVDKHPSIGLWQSYYHIRRKGFNWNHKRMYRVYTNMKLNVRRRYKKRLLARVKQSFFTRKTSMKYEYLFYERYFMGWQKVQAVEYCR